MWFMCRIKRKAALAMLGITLTLSGCGSLVTDTGSGTQQQVVREDYLKTDALGQNGPQSADDIYNVLTLEKQTFEEAALNQILRRSYINVPTVRMELEGMTCYMGEYRKDYWNWVEKGDVIATVYTQVDDIAVEEARVKLQRLQERFAEAEQQMNEEIAELTEERKLCWDKCKYDVLGLQLQQKSLDWENTKYNYEKQIEDAKENYEKMTEVGATYEVKAPVSGTVIYSTKHAAGKELKTGDYICHIMSGSQVYTSTDSQSDQFRYGMEVIFDNKNGLTPATVTNGDTWILYGNLDPKETIFRLEFDKDVSELDEVGLNNLVLKAKMKEIENVIVIPKAAVEQEEGQYYVTVLKEDGSLLKTEFIPGGTNVESYWVLDGLSEGMKIVYN